MRPNRPPDDDGTLADLLGVGTESEAQRAFRERIRAAEPLVNQTDNAWLVTIVLLLLAIHVSRMGINGSLGPLPAAVALVGDMVMALLLAAVVIVPVRLLSMRLTRRLEARAAHVIAFGRMNPTLAPMVRFWLMGRLRFRSRILQSRHSVRLAARNGLIMGLPLAALLTATVPLLGMNWSMDTEKWASIARDRWAALHTDTWRSRMRSAVDPLGTSRHEVSLPGTATGDFSFVVIGDPGQGGLSQRALARQLVEVARDDSIRFVLIASDVVYPNGEMRDYEARFWQPFSGLSKPLLAVPGNHDWYDGLEGFAATFFKVDDARRAIAARRSGDPDNAEALSHADTLIKRAEHLRREYQIPVRWQSSASFQITGDRFALITVDTGIDATLDAAQAEWLRQALEQARGKTVMVVLGHPILAAGRDQSLERPGLAKIRALLRAERVAVVMAGDTHTLEYYRDDSQADHPQHHFVSGAGGAYLSISTAIGFPSMPVTQVWAHHPTRAAIEAKIDAAAPAWARPLWWWTRIFNGFPLSGEALSSAFDYDESPFLNSFLVIHVERSANQIRVVPHGVKGPLKWRDFALSSMPPHHPDEPAQWVIPLDRTP